MAARDESWAIHKSNVAFVAWMAGLISSVDLVRWDLFKEKGTQIPQGGLVVLVSRPGRPFAKLGPPRLNRLFSRVSTPAGAQHPEKEEGRGKNSYVPCGTGNEYLDSNVCWVGRLTIWVRRAYHMCRVGEGGFMCYFISVRDCTCSCASPATPDCCGLEIQSDDTRTWEVL